MRGTIHGSILRMLLAFFAGAVSMLFFLTPGQVRFGDLLDQEKRSQMVKFNQAAERVEKANDLALFYASKAKRYIKEKIKR